MAHPQWHVTAAPASVQACSRGCTKDRWARLPTTMLENRTAFLACYLAGIKAEVTLFIGVAVVRCKIMIGLPSNGQF